MTGPQVRAMLQAITLRNKAQLRALERTNKRAPNTVEFSETMSDEQMRLMGINVIRNG